MPCLITLTTDFGYRDPFVAIMKGQILRRCRETTIVDVTHDIPTYSPAEAGFWLAHAYGYFPSGSVHVAVVDPGVGTSRNILAVAVNEHVFLAPDNGLLAAVIAKAADALVHRLDLPEAIARFKLSVPSATFHGRDIFAPLAAELAAGRARVADMGPRVRDYQSGSLAEPRRDGDRIVGQIMTIDHFGNLITNIDEASLRCLNAPTVRAGGRSFALHRTYGQGSVGQTIALINSFGLLEIAAVEGNASALLNLSRGAQVVASNN